MAKGNKKGIKKVSKASNYSDAKGHYQPRTLSEEVRDRTGQQKVDPRKPLGVSGLQTYGDGRVYEDELKALQSFTRRMKTFKEMSDNDAVIGAIVFAIKMLIRQTPWHIESEDEEIKEFLEECMNDMAHSWEEMLEEVLSFIVYGFAPMEITFKDREDGKMGWHKISLRAQDTIDHWEFDDEGNTIGLWQTAPPLYELTFIPMGKIINFKANAFKNNPEGKSAIRNAYKAWYFKKRIEMIEAIGIERDLAGYPVLYLPVEWTDSNATTEQKAFYTAAKEAVVRVKRDEQEGMLLPMVVDESGNQLVKFELLSTGGERAFDTDKIISRYNQEIARTVLADFIFLGSESTGSWALSSDKTNLFSVAIGAWLKSIAAVFNRQAIPQLLEFNGMDTDEKPELKFGDIETDDRSDMAAYIKALTDSGLDLTDFETSNFLRALGGLPEIDEKDYEEAEEEDRLAEELAREQELEANKPAEEKPEEEKPEEDKDVVKAARELIKTLKETIEHEN